jgi:hypothetical protein
LFTAVKVVCLHLERFELAHNSRKIAAKLRGKSRALCNSRRFPLHSFVGLLPAFRNQLICNRLLNPHVVNVCTRCNAEGFVAVFPVFSLYAF